jgi:stage II sporulation protein R
MIQNKSGSSELWYKLILAFLCAGLLTSAIPKPEASRHHNNFWQVQTNEPGLLRLHVMANSNRPEDQLFKSMMVEEVQRLLADNGAKWAAGETVFIDDNLPLLQHELQQYASLPGNPGPEITVSLTRAKFPLRAYGRNVYPPGEYLSLNVLIGEGMGDNWWCLLFPPLCLPVAEANESPEPDAAADECNFTEQAAISKEQDLSSKAESGWRFKFVEQWGRWFRNN